MKDIKEIIAKNLIELRKKNGLTQGEFAAKLNYSDNTVSRWERGEITPSVETLCQIGEVYGVPVEYLLKENVTQIIEYDYKATRMKHLSTFLLVLAFIWACIIVAYFYVFTFFNRNDWILFVFAIPLCCIITLFYARSFNNKIFPFVMWTVLLWSSIATVYLYFLQYNMFLIFLVGIPPQVALSIWTFVRPKKKIE